MNFQHTDTNPLLTSPPPHPSAALGAGCFEEFPSTLLGTGPSTDKPGTDDYGATPVWGESDSDCVAGDGGQRAKAAVLRPTLIGIPSAATPDVVVRVSGIVAEAVRDAHAVSPSRSIAPRTPTQHPVRSGARPGRVAVGRGVVVAGLVVVAGPLPDIAAHGHSVIRGVVTVA